MVGRSLTLMPAEEEGAVAAVRAVRAEIAEYVMVMAGESERAK